MTIKGGRRMRKHHRQRVDANTPFTLRAICPFKFVLNHKPNRIPSTLIEVECLSHSPSQNLLGRPLPLIECEPMRWTIRVLECNNDKKQEGKEEKQINCLPVEEHIPLACVPVLQANKESREPIRSEDDLTDIVAVISVPAEPLNEKFVPVICLGVIIVSVHRWTRFNFIFM
uniref:Uncharacterized protein n=1 Tax=Meloidogyne incognita TaxID=6306 RepID=A0A914N110_MELIC